MKILRYSILGLLVMATVGRAQITSPGWYQAAMPAVAIQNGPLAISQSQASPQFTQLSQPGTPVAEAITPQIQALADGLQDNPERIFDYVHDHIKYVVYFGSKKGAELTLLEKSGNDFDQCALLVALLSAAGYSNNVAYQFGWMVIPYDNPLTNNYDLHHWWQLTLNNTNWATTTSYIGNLASFRGYPVNGGYVDIGVDSADGVNGYTNNFLIQREWVALTVGANKYQLDPAFKVSLPVAGISLTNALGSGSISNTLSSVAGGTATGNYAQNLNEAALRGELTGYTTNLLNYLQNNAPNASVPQILGGSQIVPANNAVDFAPTLRLLTGTLGDMQTLTWTYEPTNLMSTLAVSFAGTNYQWFMPQLQGQRLALTYDGSGLAQLWQEDTLLASNPTSGSGTNNVVLAVTHPVGSWDLTNNVFVANPASADNITVTNSYQSTNATYNLMYAFEPDWGWLQQREQKLDGYLEAGLTNGSRQVTSETLNVMGLNWLLQTKQTEQMLAAQLGILPMYYHRLGRMAQEVGRGYYVDAYMQLSGEYPGGGNDAAHLQIFNLHFDLNMYFQSALEYGIIEQLQNTNIVGASTVKMLEIANTNGQPVYLASSTNWTTAYNVQSHLTAGSYASGTLAVIGNLISSNYYILLPKSGTNPVSSTSGGWAGYGYEAHLIGANGLTTLTEMAIEGGYQGGYDSDPMALINSLCVGSTEDNQPSSFTQAPESTPNPTVADPVDSADGTFQVAHTDLSVGQAEPHGISLARYYNGTRRYSNPVGLAGGWIHNYYANANNVAAAQAGLGGATPAQAAPMLAATAAAIATYNGGSPDPKNWLTTALIAKWGVDQLTKNGVTVNLGQDTLQFVRQPTGGFTPPANCTATLTQSNSLYSLALRHGNTFNFNSLGLLNTIVDPYNNTLTVGYNSSNWVGTVTDWKGRVLTFNYTGTNLTSVSDGTRTVYYGYSTASNPQGDLSSVTDAEGKTTTYTYDTNHQITATVDALQRLVVSNLYDTQGHVVTQYSQTTSNVWQIYWSGWQTVVQDPAGGQQTCFYDDQTRLIAQTDALGNTNQTVYDGQNHVVQTVSPLNETNQYFYDGNNNLIQRIDPLGFTNQYLYNAQNNLVATIDPLSHSNTFGYNAQFSLTGQTNGAGDWVNYVYNTTGSPGTMASRTDSGGQTSYGYDTTYGQLIGITYPGSLGSESFVNSAFGDITNHTDVRGFATSFQYNNRRQLTNSTGPNNLVIRSLSYDPVGNTATTTDGRGNSTSSTWSATRHLLTTSLPTMAQGVPVITNGYDGRDWLTCTADPLHNSTLLTNDPDGRLISQTDPLLRTTTFSYDADGHQLATVNAASETNRQTWDARGSLIQLTDGAGHSSVRDYDAAGNQIILTNRNGYKWQFQFDAANRLTNTITPLLRKTPVVFNHQGLPTLLTDPAGQNTTNTFDAHARLITRGDKVAVTTNSYDGNNNLTNVVEDGKTNSWTYDAYNRASSYRDTAGNLIQYRYDANGNITNLIYPGNLTVTYAYDSLNHLTNVTDWTGRKTALAYDLDGHLTGITRPNGTFRTISYDSAGQVTNIWEQMANGLPIAWFRLNWTNSGNMAWEFAAPLPHAVTVPTRTMTYDADNRLLTFNGQNVYSDLDGNFTNGPILTPSFTNYTYDARNRLLNAGGVTNTYDAINNRIGQAVGTTNAAYVVNPNAKLPQVLMRIKNGVTNYYIYGAGLLYQITATGTNTSTLTYHYDYRGSTIALSADSGLVTDRIEYSAYGLTTYRVGTNDTPFLYNGRYGVQTDPNGLLYMRARYYNPYLCRFINPDPSGFQGGLNFYAYANGNPVTFLDPYGLNAAATGDSDNSLLYNPNANQVPGQPCMTCHGVSAFGFNGDVNSFYGLPGSGPDALQGYSDVETGAVNATPIILSILTGNAFVAVEEGVAFNVTQTSDGIITVVHAENADAFIMGQVSGGNLQILNVNVPGAMSGQGVSTQLYQALVNAAGGGIQSITGELAGSNETIMQGLISEGFSVQEAASMTPAAAARTSAGFGVQSFDPATGILTSTK